MAMTTEVECPKEILYLKVGLFPHVSSLSTLTAIRSKCLIAMETKLNCGKFIILCHKCFFSPAPDNLLETEASYKFL